MRKMKNKKKKTEEDVEDRRKVGKKDRKKREVKDEEGRRKMREKEER